MILPCLVPAQNRGDSHSRKIQLQILGQVITTELAEFDIGNINEYNTDRCDIRYIVSARDYCIFQYESKAIYGIRLLHYYP